MIVRRAEKDDLGGLCDLFEDVFGQNVSPKHWEWKYFHELIPGVSFLAEWDGKIVAHYGGQFYPAKYKGQNITLAMGTDVMTHPEARHFTRSRAPLTLVAESYFQEISRRRSAFLIGFPGESSRKYGEKFFNYRRVSPMPLVRWPLTSDSSGELTLMDPEMWAGSFTLPSGYSSGILRDRDYLRWRYGERPGHHYHFVSDGKNLLVLKVAPPEILVMDCLFVSLKSLVNMLQALGGLGICKDCEEAKGWFPFRLRQKMQGLMDVDEISSPWIFEYRPVRFNPGSDFLRGSYFLSWGDYDVD